VGDAGVIHPDIDGAVLFDQPVYQIDALFGHPHVEHLELSTCPLSTQTLGGSPALLSINVCENHNSANLCETPAHLETEASSTAGNHNGFIGKKGR
jgi:hypothetical protein